jgi:hypothetical protein
MHEAMLGDKITLSTTHRSSDAKDAEVYFQASREKDNQEIIRARLAWS